jgi:S-adenosylmethionine:tRNA ribosyltransferase-isomerase
VLVSSFNFELPNELIAQQPLADRSGSRLLTVQRARADQPLHWRDRQFTEFPQMLREGDVLVLNDSRVIPARLYARRASSGSRAHAPSPKQEPSGKIEVLLTEQRGDWDWKSLVKPGRKVAVGERLTFLPLKPDAAQEPLAAEITERGDFGERTLRFQPTDRDFHSLLNDYGHIPLPPYIRREDSPDDRERYQTVYAQHHGSVAVPTAGLHFTPRILDEIRGRGVHICYVTLHVGLGTFQPLRVERLDEIRLHAERYTLPAETAELVNAARAENRRVIAAGTTTVRTLEHCAALAGDSGSIEAHSGSTSIFIGPGHRFRIVDALLTNFHLPQSSLLMLVAAFAGQEILDAYRHAVAERYRFFSYGDCMFIY